MYSCTQHVYLILIKLTIKLKYKGKAAKHSIKLKQKGKVAKHSV